MIPGQNDLRLEDRLRTTGQLHLSMLHRGEGRLLAAAFAGAVAIHLAAALFPLRQSDAGTEARAVHPAARRPALAQVIVPASPALPRSAPARSREAPAAKEPKPARAAPIPSSPPEFAEPLVEPEPEMAPDDLPPDAETLLGVPEPPPAGPSRERAEIDSDPELIPESRVWPAFPQRAKQLGVGGNVVLDVSVLPDGTVGEISVLRCTPPDAGFCQAASRAVKRWRYRPGVRDGRPAQVSVTVKVDFVP